MSQKQEQQSRGSIDAVVIGAGFSGLYAIHRLRAMGLEVRGFERGSGVGGTWFFNRYPGARCDVESFDYSYSFSRELEQEWHWSERFAAQPEILSYLEHVADRFDLRPLITFDTRIISAALQPDGRWCVASADGERVLTRFLIMATGVLSASRTPAFPGLSTFRGETYHTGDWPDGPVDFTGKRVGVIGTGSSGTQVIPAIARDAHDLFVFQRTPNFSVPARNVPTDQAAERERKASYPAYRTSARESGSGIPIEPPTRSALEVGEQERLEAFEARWARGGGTAFGSTFTDISTNAEANATAAEFVRTKIYELVEDPNVAEMLCRQDYPIGTKRLCVDTGYYETYNRENVHLVDVRTHPIEAVTATGLRTSAADYALDAIVFATGYDAMTGPLLAIRITGRDGATLDEAWRYGPRSLLGIQVTGFPNLFTIVGPGSPSVLSNMVVSIEQHVEWATDLIGFVREQRLDTVEATLEAQDDWVQYVNDVADLTLYPSAASWYMGANVPGKPRVFMPFLGGVGPYRRLCTAVASEGYPGFAFTRGADRLTLAPWSRDILPTPGTRVTVSAGARGRPT